MFISLYDVLQLHHRAGDIIAVNGIGAILNGCVLQSDVSILCPLHGLT